MPDPDRARRWGPNVKARAEELGRDRDLAASDVRRAIREELGADVPLSTVGRWVKDVRRREPIDRQAMIRDVADRATALLSSELARIERQTRERDLGKVDVIARTLKTLASIDTGKGGAQRQTLADLGSGGQTEGRAGGPMRAAA